MEVKPPRRTLPLAVLSDAGIAATGARELFASTAGRMELLAIWDRLSDEGRRFMLIMARSKAEEEKSDA